MDEKLYFISVLTYNEIGILQRIAAIMSRRHINIESINASPSELEGAHRCTFTIKTSEEQVKKVVGQIVKQVDVESANYYTEDQLFTKILALYKLPTQEILSKMNLEDVISEFNVRIQYIDEEKLILSKVGSAEEINKLYKLLKPFNLMGFNRSGRILVRKD